MPKALNLAARRCGRLVVRRPAPRDARGRTRWLCDCDCGNTAVVATRYLSRHDTGSCGCKRAEARAGARAAGNAAVNRRRPKVCRVCSRPYEGTACQKYCSDECRAEWYAEEQYRRRAAGTLGIDIIRVEEEIRGRADHPERPAE